MSSPHPLTTYLHTLIHAKQSPLCVSADVTTASAMLSLAAAVGPSIAVFKTHADMHAGWDPDPERGTGAQLAALARRHRFLVFEDRKFADIGFTVQAQYAGGDHRIVEWAHVVNAHAVAGEDVLRALEAVAGEWVERNGSAKRGDDAGAEAPPPDERALLVVAQMSSANNLLDSRYTRACVDMARRHRAFVMGFIAMEPLNEMPDDDFVVMTPGCALPREESLDGSEWAGGDALGQRYVSPQELMRRGCDLVIVGTGICNAQDPAAKAEQYRKAAWDVYEERLTSGK